MSTSNKKNDNKKIQKLTPSNKNKNKNKNKMKHALLRT